MPPNLGNTLVLGGARSGKSRFAEGLAQQTKLKKIYLATAQAFDAEMQQRIAQHQESRAQAGWLTQEEPLELPQVLAKLSTPENVVLVDCLTLWLSNIMLAGRDVAKNSKQLAEALMQAKGPVVLVSNEVGMGIVPETPLGRQFRDEQGRLNQSLANLCNHVFFIAAGLPLTLKTS